MFCVPNRQFIQAAWLAATLAAALGFAAPAQAIEMSSSTMQALGAATPPIGFVAFCARNSRECSGGGGSATVALTPESFAELDRVNRSVNDRISPATDLEMHRTAELWSIPTSRGDCEDYVLLKKHVLIQAGWSPSSLLITVVRDQHGEGHAVLTVVTDKGDLVLDNQRDSVTPWQRTPYRYVKRQSQANPRAWVYVGTADAGSKVASTR